MAPDILSYGRCPPLPSELGWSAGHRRFLLGGMAHLGEEVKFRLGQVRSHPVPLGRGQDAVSFSPDEGRGLGFDTDASKVERLNRWESYIQHIPSSRLAALLAPREGAGQFAATHDLGRLGEPDVLIICVPTPLTSKREPDLRFVEQTTRQIAACLRPGQLVSLESTTYPGTTAELLLPILGVKHQVGEDVYLVFSPEREDPGNPTFQVRARRARPGAKGWKG